MTFTLCRVSVTLTLTELGGPTRKSSWQLTSSSAHFQSGVCVWGFPHLTASAFLSPSPGGPGGRVQSGVRNRMRIHRRSRSSREQVPQVHQSSVAPEQAWSGLCLGRQNTAQVLVPACNTSTGIVSIWYLRFERDLYGHSFLHCYP